MGYSHRWERPQVISASTFDTITDDFRRFMPALEAAGSPTANAWGREEAEFSSETVLFNGVENCGHAPNPGVRLPGPARDAAGIGDNSGMGCTLPYRTCNGDCSYETFRFDRCIDAEWMDDDGTYSSYCKTAFRPTTSPYRCSCSSQSTISGRTSEAPAMAGMHSGRMHSRSAGQS